jgi:hypothetical protein
VQPYRDDEPGATSAAPLTEHVRSRPLIHYIYKPDEQAAEAAVRLLLRSDRSKGSRIQPKATTNGRTLKS